MSEYPDLNEQLEIIANSKKRRNLLTLNIKPVEIDILISREEKLCPYKCEAQEDETEPTFNDWKSKEEQDD